MNQLWNRSLIQRIWEDKKVQVELTALFPLPAKRCRPLVKQNPIPTMLLLTLPAL